MLQNVRKHHVTVSVAASDFILVGAMLASVVTSVVEKTADLLPPHYSLLGG